MALDPLRRLWRDVDHHHQLGGEDEPSAPVENHADCVPGLSHVGVLDPSNGTTSSAAMTIGHSKPLLPYAGALVHLAVFGPWTCFRRPARSPPSADPRAPRRWGRFRGPANRPRKRARLRSPGARWDTGREGGPIPPLELALRAGRRVVLCGHGPRARGAWSQPRPAGCEAVSRRLDRRGLRGDQARGRELSTSWPGGTR
jgi:hypothetical protein